MAASKLGKALDMADEAPPSSAEVDPDADGYLTDEDVAAYKDYQALAKSSDHKAAAMALKTFVKGC